MNTIYTHSDWQRDGTFKAAPGQEVEESIYDQMLDCMPSFRLPRCEGTEIYATGFLVSEPYDTDHSTGENFYAAFGLLDGKCYFVGYMTRNGRIQK